VYPTPVIGMVGLAASLEHVTRSSFTVDGDAIVLLGEPTAELGGSEYLARVHGVVAGAPPACDLGRERALIDALLEAIAAGVVRSAHDCSDGGLAVALAECAVGDAEHPLGAEVDLAAWSALPLRALLFGEAQGRVIVSGAQPDRVLAIAAAHGVAARRIGTVRATSGTLEIRVGSWTFAAPLARLASAYHDAIPNIMSSAPGEAAVLEQHPQPSAS
ncbi:MAG: AIR synthase-related protein, partial [Gemmatimonadaceae bacterium]